MRKQRCYMCDNDATSREHVPPLCLFPQAKDIGGEDCRRNLITVPSCDLHNSKKKLDDEFLMVSLAGIIGNNSIGYRHRFGKVERSVRGDADRLLRSIILVRQRVDTFEVTNNQFVDVIWGTPDVARLNRCFEHIAYGLHKYHFGERFNGQLFVHLGYLKYAHPNAAAWNAFLRDRVTLDLQGATCNGENPDVFYYQARLVVAL